MSQDAKFFAVFTPVLVLLMAVISVGVIEAMQQVSELRRDLAAYREAVNARLAEHGEPPIVVEVQK